MGDEGIEERPAAPHHNEDLLLGHVGVPREGLLAREDHLAPEADRDRAGLLLGWLVASFFAGKEDGDRPPRPQGSKVPLRGDSSGSLEEGSKRTPVRSPRAGLLRGKIH